MTLLTGRWRAGPDSVTNRLRRRPPTVPTPNYAVPANAPTPSSKPGASCANSAAARGAPGNWPRPYTFFRPARSEDKKRSLSRGPRGGAVVEVSFEPAAFGVGGLDDARAG